MVVTASWRVRDDEDGVDLWGSSVKLGFLVVKNVRSG